MALFTAEGLNYTAALDLISTLRESGVEANITAGGVAIHVVTAAECSLAESICAAKGASFAPGYSAHQEQVLLKAGDFDALVQIDQVARSLWRKNNV